MADTRSRKVDSERGALHSTSCPDGEELSELHCCIKILYSNLVHVRVANILESMNWRMRVSEESEVFNKRAARLLK